LALIQRGGNCFEYTRQVIKHVVVPKPQDAVSLIDKPSIPFSISGIRRVLTAIDLDNEATFATDEIYRVTTNRFLPNEFEARQHPPADAVPQAQFCVRRIFAKPARPASSGVRSSHRKYAPHPARSARRPLPASGERLTPRAEI
jgi:hypothetical protein